MKKLVVVILIFLTFLLSPLGSMSLFALSESEQFDYNNYHSFNFITTDNFYTVNKTNNYIEHYNQGQITSYNQHIDKFNTYVKFFKVLKNGEFAVLDGLNRLHFLDSNFNTISVVQYINTQNQHIPLQNIIDMKTDIYSNVYLVDQTQNLILKANSSMEDFSVLKNTIDADNTKITLLNTLGEYAILQNNKIIYKDATLDLTEDSYEIFSDALNFIYVVQENKILKYDTTLTLVDEKIASRGTEYNLILENGEIIYINNNEVLKIINFASNTSNYEPPCDINSKTLLDFPVEICNIKSETSLLQNPYSQNSNIKLNVGDEVIKLATTNEFTSNFIYAAFVKNNKLNLGYIEEKYIETKQIETKNYIGSPIRNDIHYFKFPTIIVQNLESPLLNIHSTYLITREIQIDNLNFVEIKLNDNYVYCLQNEILDTSSKYINSYLQTNAKLKLYNNEKEINLYDTIEKDNIILTLNKTTNIKIIKSHGDLTEISLIKDNQIIKCFVETKFIAVQSKYIIPLTISLITICLIILVVLIVKFKKEPTNKSNRKTS